MFIHFLQKTAENNKNSAQTGQAVKRVVHAWLHKFHITKTYQYDPYMCNAYRWMKRKIRSSNLCSLDYIEEGHWLGLLSP